MSATPGLFRISYLSRNLLAMGEAESGIRDILTASRRNNPRRGVTGALLFTADCFAQVLEGPEAEVNALFERISADPRHADVLVLEAGPAPVATFAAWSMAYIGPSADITAQFAAIAPGGSAPAASAVLGLLQSAVGGLGDAGSVAA